MSSKGAVANLLASLVIYSIVQSDAYRPVAMIHGVTNNYKEFSELTEWIQADFPGIKTFALDAFNDYNSYPSLVRQVSWFSHQLEKITDVYGEVTLIGYSQGGLIARGMVQTSDNPYIHTFISASAPGKLKDPTDICSFTSAYSNSTFGSFSFSSHDIFFIFSV